MSSELTFNFHANGLVDRVKSFTKEPAQEAQLSSIQFWVRFFDVLVQLENSDSVTADEAISCLVNVLDGAGKAIEHLEQRVANLEGHLANDELRERS
ncbi:hypothetical protein WG936_08060 [Corynebacterium sp. H127]|uniref:hypothetical protein n=1 Tax=Corynebacterium sp. H127 TaxID=3133418 RepID=UPI003099C22C